MWSRHTCLSSFAHPLSHSPFRSLSLPLSVDRLIIDAGCHWLLLPLLLRTADHSVRHFGGRCRITWNTRWKVATSSGHLSSNKYQLVDTRCLVLPPQDMPALEHSRTVDEGINLATHNVCHPFELISITTTSCLCPPLSVCLRVCALACVCVSIEKRNGGGTAS